MENHHRKGITATGERYSRARERCPIHRRNFKRSFSSSFIINKHPFFLIIIKIFAAVFKKRKK
jgi:hypothetical protein